MFVLKKVVLVLYFTLIVYFNVVVLMKMNLYSIDWPVVVLLKLFGWK